MNASKKRREFEKAREEWRRAKTMLEHWKENHLMQKLQTFAAKRRTEALEADVEAKKRDMEKFL